MSEVAKAALDVGADMLNDISAASEDEAMLNLSVEANAPICLMHMQGEPGTMQENPSYKNVSEEVTKYLLDKAKHAQSLGVSKDNIILDPGIGFGKRTSHNLQLLRDLKQITDLGYPVLLGTSRKRFMGEIAHEEDPRKRMPATCATTALGVAAGVKIFRVHDVWQNRQAMDVAFGICNS